MGYSGDDCDTCEDLRSQLEKFDRMMRELTQAYNMFDWDAVGRAIAKAKA